VRTFFDLSWKLFAQVFLRPLLALCFPQVEAQIDWSVPPKFRDKELQRILPRPRRGSRVVDLLIEVKLRNGQFRWILLHLEIEHRKSPQLPLRLFDYNYLIRKRYNFPVVTLAILADEDPNWRPSFYEDDRVFGCGVKFDFLTCKLLDLINQGREQLERSDSPAAAMVLANWTAQKTRRDADRRLVAKLDFARRLRKKKYSREEVEKLFRCIDQLMWLPEKHDEQFLEELYKILKSKGQNMPIEEILSHMEIRALKRGRKEGIEKGIEKGMEKGIEKGLEKGIEAGRLQALREDLLEVLHIRLGPVSSKITRQIAAEENCVKLKGLLRRALRCSKADDLF
jgi:hypothetical protein